MERLRTRWAALIGATLLLLVVAGVTAAGHITLPTVAAPQAQEQATKEHEADEDTDEDTTVDEDVDETTDEPTTDQPVEDTSAAQGEHGALVSAVAQNKECVGGPHENHGWAVSQVARGLLVPDAITGCPIEPLPEAVTEDTVPDATTDLNPAGKAKGKSADHKQQKTKTHGRWATQP